MLEKMEENEKDEEQMFKMKKRDAKLLNKRERTIEKVQKEAIKKYKNDIKASIAEDEVKERIKKL